MNKIFYLVIIIFSLPVFAGEGDNYNHSVFSDRDPFYSLINERGEINIREEREIGDIILQGIVYSAEDSSVVINNEIFHEGDSFEDYHIKEIKANGVIFEKDKEEYFLKWEE